jgi:poly-beta-1,6-N-acetyl-D-glucosamine synthase
MFAPIFMGLLYGAVLLYAGFIFRCLLAWRKMSETRPPADFHPSTFISVVVPVRNEAENISHLLADLAALHYPPSLFEVLVVDDHSEDGTGPLVQAFSRTSPYPLHYLPLPVVGGRTGKKEAIRVGVEQAQGEWIQCTDGDCRVQPEWLLLAAWMREKEGARFLAGPVFFWPLTRLFAKMQAVEFSALTGVGASSIQAGSPNMCNGAHVGYEKECFGQVGGFAGNEQVPSGDDEFLMHKFHQAFPGKVKFLKSPLAVVYTAAKSSGRGFLAQRVRWASKWRHYERKEVQGLALLVFAVNLLLFMGIFLAVAGLVPWLGFGLSLVIKIGVDFVFLSQVLRFYGHRHLLPYALPLQLVYVPYVVLTALGGLYGQYEWKGRKQGA